MEYKYNCAICGKSQKTGWISFEFARFIFNKPCWCDECNQVIEKYLKLVN